MLFLVLFGAVMFRIGVQCGAWKFALVDSPYKAYIAAVNLQKLEREDYTFLKIMNEHSLTREITNYGLYLEHGKPWIFWPYPPDGRDGFPGSGSAVNSPEHFIKFAIRLRKSRPVERDSLAELCRDRYKGSDFCVQAAERDAAYYRALSSVD